MAISLQRYALHAGIGVAVALLIAMLSARPRQEEPETNSRSVAQEILAPPPLPRSIAPLRVPRVALEARPFESASDLESESSPPSEWANRPLDNSVLPSAYLHAEDDEDAPPRLPPRLAKRQAPTKNATSDDESAPAESDVPPRTRMDALLDAYRERTRDDESTEDQSEPRSLVRERIGTLPDPMAPNPIVVRADAQDKLTIVLKSAPIRDVLDLLGQQGNLNILTSPAVTGDVTATLQGVSLEDGLAAILKAAGLRARREAEFLYVGTPTDFQSIDAAQDVIATRIYQPNYVKATELLTLLTPITTPTIGKVTITKTSDVDIPPDQNKTGGDGYAGQDCLLVRDYESVLCEIDQIVAEVDRRPRQVEIEATILSVKLDDTHKMGVNFQALRNIANIRLATGAPPTALGSVALDGGLKVAYLDSSLGSLVEALETVGETNVIASPRLMCLNKQRAEIQIGERLGFISTTVTETAATQSVQFLDVGTLLRLRPFISSDGSIRMELHPELSTGQVRVQGNTTLPNKTVTQVTTNVMCQDGNTVILGGLMREDLGSSSKQIPLLGGLPYVGGLFRQKTSTVSRSELLVVVTPRLVHDPCAAEEGTAAEHEFRLRQATYFDKIDWTQKRVIGQKYLRKARAAWSAGDGDAAIKHANTAIHYDPMNREAAKLRAEIAEAQFPNESQHEYLKQGLGPRHSPDYTPCQPWKDELGGSIDGKTDCEYDRGTPARKAAPVRPIPSGGFDNTRPSRVRISRPNLPDTPHDPTAPLPGIEVIPPP